MHYPLIIGSQSVDSPNKLLVNDPATGEKIGSVAKGTAEDTTRAIEAAQEAVPRWKRITPQERRRMLHAIADRIEEESGEITHLLSRETGKCLDTARGEVNETIGQFRFYAGAVEKIRGDTIPTPSHRFNYTKRVPYGVTAHIVPWNYPLLLGSRGIAAALATGNTVVVKPPSKAPLTTMWYGEHIQNEVPDGVANFIPGPGSEIGATLSANKNIDAISFTGSTRVGQQVLESASHHVIPVDVELGGKSPAIVLPDADTKSAGVGIAKGIFSNAGQNCVALSRLVIHEDVKEEVINEIVAQAEAITLGPGTNPETDMGPLISRNAVKDMQRYVDLGKEQGATLLTGGKQPEDPALADGYFFEPTVFDNVENDMRIAQEEIFGPILAVITVPSIEKAIKVANDSSYALAASIWTERLTAAEIADKLDHGLVAINTFPVSMPQSPWGGNKQSGIGREGGLEGLEAFTTVNSVVVEHDDMNSGYR